MNIVAFGRTRRLLGLAFALVFAGVAATEAFAQGAAKLADCQIDSGGRTEFKGKCRFVNDGSTGSFSLSSQTGQGALFGAILDVSVSIVRPGLAEVRGLTKDGINSRWGEARRSAQQPACWVGSDFKVCAW